jgi:hypothetical protein
MGCTTGVVFPVGVRDFSLFHSAQIGSGAPTTLLFNGYRGCEDYHSPPSSAKIKTGGVISLLYIILQKTAQFYDSNYCFFILLIDNI